MARKPMAIVVHSQAANQLIPHGFCGIYPILVQNPSFQQDYHHVATMGDRGDDFYYWIFSYCGK